MGCSVFESEANLGEITPLFTKRNEIENASEVSFEDSALQIALGEVVERLLQYKVFIQLTIATSAPLTSEQLSQSLKTLVPSLDGIIIKLQNEEGTTWSICALDKEKNLYQSKQWALNGNYFLVLRAVETEIDSRNVKNVAIQYAKLSHPDH